MRSTSSALYPAFSASEHLISFYDIQRIGDHHLHGKKCKSTLGRNPYLRLETVWQAVAALPQLQDDEVETPAAE